MVAGDVSGKVEIDGYRINNNRDYFINKWNNRVYRPFSARSAFGLLQFDFTAIYTFSTIFNYLSCSLGNCYCDCHLVGLLCCRSRNEKIWRNQRRSLGSNDRLNRRSFFYSYRTFDGSSFGRFYWRDFKQTEFPNCLPVCNRFIYRIFNGSFYEINRMLCVGFLFYQRIIIITLNRKNYGICKRI